MVKRDYEYSIWSQKRNKYRCKSENRNSVKNKKLRSWRNLWPEFFSIRICLLQIYDLTFLMPDIIAQHPEILSGCIRFFLWIWFSLYWMVFLCRNVYSQFFFWGTYRRKNKYEAIQGLPKKAYPEFSPGRLFYCVNWQKPGSGSRSSPAASA